MANLLLTEHISRDIPGYKGLYYATTDGRIFSHEKTWKFGSNLNSTGFRPERRPHSFYAGAGYEYVHLTVREKKYISRGVHRLVALTFIPNPFNKPEIHHIDDDKLNNNYWNLMWVTTEEHAEFTRKRWQKGADRYNAIITEKQAIEILKSPKSNKELQEEYGISSGLVSSIKLGITWKHLREQHDAVLTTKPYPSAKLTEEQVVEIICSEEKGSVLSILYGVSQSVISNIQTGKTWKYITDAMATL